MAFGITKANYRGATLVPLVEGMIAKGNHEWAYFLRTTENNSEVSH